MDELKPKSAAEVFKKLSPKNQILMLLLAQSAYESEKKNTTSPGPEERALPKNDSI